MDRFPNSALGGRLELQDSIIIRFKSSKPGAMGLHTAVHTDCAYPPMTLFAVIDVLPLSMTLLASFEYDGTNDLLRVCKQHFGGNYPTPLAMPRATCTLAVSS
jgi:hypothetical protein